MERNSFDRMDEFEITDATSERFRDKERLMEGWERVYTVISVRHPTGTPTKIIYATGGEDKLNLHEEEPNPASDVVYHTEREYHCRRHNRGVIILEGGCTSGTIQITWHGYDKLIRER